MFSFHIIYNTKKFHMCGIGALRYLSCACDSESNLNEKCAISTQLNGKIDVAYECWLEFCICYNKMMIILSKLIVYLIFGQQLVIEQCTHNLIFCMHGLSRIFFKYYLSKKTNFFFLFFLIQATSNRFAQRGHRHITRKAAIDIKHKCVPDDC